MKIRWTHNSVRLRITPTELDALTRGEAVEETLRAGGSIAWTATLAPGDATALTAAGAAVTLTLAAADVARLAHPEAEGVYFTADEIRYFVEKDFPCAHPRAAEAMEPPSETFAAPPGFEERKN